MLASRPSPSPQRPGYVLIAVLLVIVVLSLTAYRFADAMSAEFAVAFRNTEAAQARSFAVSGVHYTIAALNDPNTLLNVLGGNPHDNASFFSNIPVGTITTRGGGRFSIVRVEENGDSTSGAGRFEVKYGVTDEAGKINLNTMMRIDSSGEALRAMLILLPNMTEDVADAITDWLDADEDQRDSGAEAGAYATYTPRNGPVSSLDELLLVRGVTASLLYGADRNRNGREDFGELLGTTEFSRGWSDYLTVYGHELNVDSTGQPRLYVNNSDMTTVYPSLVTALGQSLADYAMAYRLYTTSSSLVPASGQTVVGTAEQLSTAVQQSINSKAQPKRQIKNSIMSLLNTRVTLPRAAMAPPDAPTIVIDCPLNNAEYLKSAIPTLLDKVTAKSNYELNPRINVNTCPQQLLAVLPGVTPEDIASSVTARANLDPLSAEAKTGSWLVTQAGMRSAIFQQIEPYVGGYTQTYRIQSIGYFAQGGPVARVEAVVDTNAGYPRIVYYRDLTELGGGFTPPR